MLTNRIQKSRSRLSRRLQKLSSKYALISHINTFRVPADIPYSHYFRNGHTYIISEGSRRYKEYIDSQVFYDGNDFTATRSFPSFLRSGFLTNSPSST